MFEFERYICWNHWDAWQQYILLNFPFKIVASIMLFINFFTESLVPLQSRNWLIFLRRIMSTSNFNVRMCGSISGISSEFKNLFGYLTTLSWFITVLMDWSVVVSPKIPYIMWYWLYLHHNFGCQYSPCTDPLTISVVL